MKPPGEKDTRTFPGRPTGEADAPNQEKRALPESIGHYRIVRELGEGGMGVVYEAVQHQPRRRVALKIVRGGSHVDPLHVRMFQREVESLGRLKHRSIAAIYESGITDDGQHFFAMELVGGVTLSEWLEHREQDATVPAELRLRLGLFRRICHAVAYAHQRGVIHRDIKPSNILIHPAEERSSGSISDPGIPDVKILDFGLARITESDVVGNSVQTEIGRVQGTLQYMSPEQVRGDSAEIDLRTDVYSLGVLLYELLTGRLPYDLTGAALPEVARAICDSTPLPLMYTLSQRSRPDRDVSTIVRKALEKEPDRRYQSVSAFGEDIDRYLTDQPILARPPNAAYQLRKLIHRHKALFGASVGVAVLTVAFAVTMSFMYLRAETATLQWKRASAQAEAATRRAEAESRRAREQATRAEAERRRADESREEIARTSRDLQAIVPELRARLGEYEKRVRQLEQERADAAATEAPSGEETSDPPLSAESEAHAPEAAAEVVRVGSLLVPPLVQDPDRELKRQTDDLLSSLRVVQGRIALQSGNYGEAEVHLLQCQRELPDGRRKEECLVNLIRLYDRQGSTDRAAPYRRELERLRRERSAAP